MDLTLHVWRQGAPDADGGMSSTLRLTAVGHLGAHFAMLVYPTVAVAIARSEGIALDVVLGWSFYGYLLFGLGGLPVGLLTDHFRARWVVRIGVVCGLAVNEHRLEWVPVGDAPAIEADTDPGGRQIGVDRGRFGRVL